MSKFVRRHATRFFIILVAIASMTEVAPATEPVWEAQVQAVSQTQRPQQGWEHRQAGAGAALGAAIGTLAARNSNYEKRAVAGLVGAVLGAGIGSRRDRDPNRGWDVVVCSTPNTGWQRCETLFLEQEPWFRPGDVVFVARDRLIYAGRSELVR